MARAFNRPGRTIASAYTGMVSVYAKYYPVATPNIMHSLTFHDLVRTGQPLPPDAPHEKADITKKAHRLDGPYHRKNRLGQGLHRADQPFGSVSPLQRNPARRLYSTEKWSFERCERHSIFVSSSFPSYKCFHHVLEAMPHILSRYPDAKVHVTGPDVNRIPWYRISMLRTVCKKLIRELGLKDKVYFGRAERRGNGGYVQVANVYVLLRH